MATDPQFVDFLLDQLRSLGALTGKKMFGEYGLYAGDTLFALVCGNQLLLKPTPAGRTFLQEAVKAAPYAGAKPSFLIGEGLEDREWLQQLVRLTAAALPLPKPKQPKPSATPRGAGSGVVLNGRWVPVAQLLLTQP